MFYLPLYAISVTTFQLSSFGISIVIDSKHLFNIVHCPVDRSFRHSGHIGQSPWSNTGLPNVTLNTHLLLTLPNLGTGLDKYIHAFHSVANLRSEKKTYSLLTTTQNVTGPQKKPYSLLTTTQNECVHCLITQITHSEYCSLCCQINMIKYVAKQLVTQVV